MRVNVEKIINFAKEKDFSIRKLEYEANLSNGAIARWSEHPPAIDKVYRVAKVLGCTVDDLIREEPEATGGTEAPETYFRSVAQ